MTDQLTPAPSTGHARGHIRPAYGGAGLTLLVAATWGAFAWETGLSSVLVFAVLPDAALLLAIGQPHRPGQLPPTAVPAYNLMHHPAVPAVLFALAALGLLGSYWFVAALAWAAHIAVDRGVGYGLRGRDGWQRG